MRTFEEREFHVAQTVELQQFRFQGYCVVSFMVRK